MTLRSVALATAFVLVALPACQKPAPEPEAAAPPAADTGAAPQAVERPEAAPAEPAPAPEAKAEEPMEPGRTSCGVISLVLPEGSQVTTTPDPEAGNMTGRISVPGGIIVEYGYFGGQEMYPGFADDESLLTQLQKWIDGLGPEVADEFTPEVIELKEPTIHGYYTVVKAELSGKKGKKYALNGFFALDGHVVTLGGLHDDDSGAANDTILGIIKSAKWELE